MADEAIEETEPINTDLEPEQEQQPDVDTLKARLEAVEAEKDLQHKRATKAEAENKELKKLKQSDQSPEISERLERQDLRLEGYDRDEVDFLMTNGGSKALENKLVLAGIEAMRKEKKSTNATPTGTGKSTVYQKYTEQDLKKMSAEELEKIVPQ